MANLVRRSTKTSRRIKNLTCYFNYKQSIIVVNKNRKGKKNEKHDNVYLQHLSDYFN